MVARTRIHSVLRTPLLVLRTLVVARTPLLFSTRSTGSHIGPPSTRNFSKKVSSFLAFTLQHCLGVTPPFRREYPPEPPLLHSASIRENECQLILYSPIRIRVSTDVKAASEHRSEKNDKTNLSYEKTNIADLQKKFHSNLYIMYIYILLVY